MLTGASGPRDARGGVEAFVVAATTGRCARARRLLEAEPELERDPWVRLVLGRDWAGGPSGPGGPRGLPPLLYVAHSCFASVRLARSLLEQGADPNAAARDGEGRFTALSGAAGVVNDPELTAALLEAGADPNDGESLYHAAGAPDAACLRLLLRHGGRPAGTNALPRALDDDRLEHVRLLLEAGADPDEGAVLVHAVRRGCGLETIRLLLEHGADPERRGGEWSTPRARHKTAYQNAILRGRDDVADLLLRAGASPALDPEDAAVASIVRGDPEAPALPRDALSPDAQEALISAALAGRLDAVVDAVGADFFGHLGGGPPGTLLHHAAWLGRADVVTRLLARGADPSSPSGADLDTPAAWAAHGSGHGQPGGDHVAVMERLVAAGARLEPRFLDVADGPLVDWLAARL